MNQVTRPKVDSVLPSDLVEWTLLGRMRVPSFQRSYRWDRHDVTRLFDSIFRGYPIGNLLAWERSAPAETVTLGHLTVEAPATPNAYWIVDGQQRIVSLVGALTAGPDTADPRFRIYFDLRKGQFVSAARSQEPLEHWMPAYVTLNTARANNWIRSHPELSESQITTADQVVAAVRDYKIPMYVVTGNDDHALRDIFDRMNTYGQALKSEEVFNALHSVPGEKNPSDLHSLAEGVRSFDFGDFSERILMQSLLAIRGPRIDRDFRDEFQDNADRHKAFIDTERAIGQVIAILRDIAEIPHIKLLPYSFYVPLLARFVASFGMPQGWTSELIRRWIWRGAVVGVAPQGNTIALRRGAFAIREDPISSVNRLLELLPHGPEEDWQPDLSQIALNRAFTKVNILGMLSREPALLTSQSTHDLTPIEFSVLLDQGQILTQIVSGDGYLERTVANRLVYPPFLGTSMLEELTNASSAALRSHCIDDYAADMLLAGRYEEFLDRRAETLSVVIKEHVQNRALFGFRDGPNVLALFDEVEDGASNVE
jgi:Protein of unknown function DUF262